jgi:two-component system OmpR family response regulator
MSRILVVEDDLAQREILLDSLKEKGFVVLEARDGAEGLKTALREHPDLILLDIRMPRMDGMTMMHRLREDNWGSKALIIILTNYDSNDEQISQIAIDHPSYYLVKANNPMEDIIEKIEELLSSSKKEEKQGIIL